ncbi:MAG: peptidase U32 family protein [Acidobacteriota bacterium]
MKNKPELVCPAGNWSGMITAVESGADSVYFGVKGLNMRASASNFDILEIKKVMKFLHEKGKKGYLALNVVVMNSELDKMKKILEEAASAGVDAVILWDMAVLSMAKDLGLNIHISTQASISNYEALKFYSTLGIKRAVLARELTLEEIRSIVDLSARKEGAGVEVEAFVHGAMCVSISGRCFLSSYSWGKSANKGECRQSCRREFEIRDSSGEAEYVVGKDYLLSPKDLNAMPFIDELIKAGIQSFKIEGRMRSLEYINVVVSSYRKAIDLYFSGELDSKVKEELSENLSKVYNRGFSDGFYFGEPKNWTSRKLAHKNEKLFLGEVTKFYKKINVAEILIRSNEVKKGDRLFITGKNTPASFADAEELQQEHEFVDSASKGEMVGIKLPFTARRGDQVYIWREKKRNKEE